LEEDDVYASFHRRKLFMLKVIGWSIDDGRKIRSRLREDSRKVDVLSNG
jgi:hypothetical protein